MLTLNSFPIERKPKPSRYKRRACFFIDSGLAVDFIATAVFALMTLPAFGETRFYLFFHCGIWDNSFYFFLQMQKNVLN
ncbi:hypothetical protein Barb4_02178 [Bacteroidales bacterium Barb4]|nr:hypothetical protein Barb4_02178 [Bacteroidales bacterium Barb4]